jgi:hypothetical protein
MMGFTLVPASIATIALFFPFAFLLVIIVYNSPWDRAVLSMERCASIFWGKRSHSLECSFLSHSLKSLK